MAIQLCQNTLDSDEEKINHFGLNRGRIFYSLALRAVAVHAVLYGLVAGLANGPTGHLYSQTCFCAPLDASFQLPALCIHCRETDTNKSVTQLLYTF